MYKSKTTPRVYQEKALTNALEKRKYGLFMDPGTGKTLIAITFMGMLFKQGEINKVLVVAPVLAMGVWEDELEKHLDESIPYEVIYAEGRNKKKLLGEASNKPPSQLTVLVISYDSAANSIDELLDYQGQVLILDESHYIKNHTTARCKAMNRLKNQYENRLLLTGTPLPKGPLDIYGQFLVMNERLLGNNFFKIKNMICILGGFQKKQVLGYKKENLKKLKKIINSNAIRVTKDALGLPPINEQIINIALKNETKELYNEFAKEMIAEYGSNVIVASIPIVKAMRLKQITSGFTRDDENKLVEISTEKVDACQYLLEGLIPKEKVVIFAHYKYEILQIAKRVKQMGYTPLLIFGGVKRTNRDKYRKLFQTSDKYPVIICQLGAGGLGIDLYAARYAIFFSLDRQSDHLMQCTGRIYRTGQQRPVFLYYLIVKGTIDTLVYKSNKAKIDLAEYMVGQQIKLL